MILDALLLGWRGITARPGRTLMSALGIALGVATLVLVTGIPSSGQADLDRRLTALGTNVLVAQGGGLTDQPVLLPTEAAGMVDRIAPVEHAAAVANLDLRIQRTELSDPNETIGITVLATRPDLARAVKLPVASGTFLTAATDRIPAVVLGRSAAYWLGIDEVDPLHPPRVRVGSAWLAVVGVLGPMPLTPELEQSAFVGWDAARSVLGFDGRPSVVYLTAAESRIEQVRDVLPATLSPETPGLITVSRPSEALAAKRASQHTFSGLFLGLALVALVIGATGVANTMIVSVLERRREIGLRRALGASRGDVRLQFLTEAVLLASVGGAAGLVLGLVGVLGYAEWRDWPVVVPVPSAAAGLLATVVIGAVAGIYPALRAARLSPTEALATP